MWPYDHIRPDTREPNIVKKIYKDTTTQIVTVSDILTWQHQTAGVATLEGTLISGLITKAITNVEKYIWRDITQAVYQAYYDLNDISALASNLKLIIPRSPILDVLNIQKIEYLDVNGNWVNYDFGTALGIPGLYTNVTNRLEQRDWASIFFLSEPAYDQSRTNGYKMRVTFSCGYDYIQSGNVSLSYNNTTGLVTATISKANIPVNDQVTISGTGVSATLYNGTYDITQTSLTSFTYQLSAGLNLPVATGTYTTVPNDVNDIPESLIIAIKEIVSASYLNRGDVLMDAYDVSHIPASTRSMLDSEYSVGRTVLE